MSSINSGSIVLAGSPNVKITNLAITTPNVEVSHVLQDNLTVLEFKAREDAELKYSFVVAESGTKYMTVPKCSGQSFTGIKLKNKTIYIQSPLSCTVEIIEFYS